MIPDFKTFLKESVWSDMHKRSTGNAVRKEDDVNNLSMEGFEEYLKNHYEYVNKNDEETGKAISSNKIHTSIGVSTFFIKDKIGRSFFYIHYDYDFDNDSYILNLSRTSQPLHIFDELRKNYIVRNSEKGYTFLIEPKHGKINNSFLLEVLDFILDNLEEPEAPMIIKKQ